MFQGQDVLSFSWSFALSLLCAVLYPNGLIHISTSVHELNIACACIWLHENIVNSLSYILLSWTNPSLFWTFSIFCSVKPCSYSYPQLVIDMMKKRNMSDMTQIWANLILINGGNSQSFKDHPFLAGGTTMYRNLCVGKK